MNDRVNVSVGSVLAIYALGVVVGAVSGFVVRWAFWEGKS